jgi:class 3 adenylate cyclase/CHASE2 domain-containing sensor protein
VSRRVDLPGLALLVAAGAVWWLRDDAAWAVAPHFKGVGFPLLSLLIRAGAFLLLAAALVRLRTTLANIGAGALKLVDAGEARLEKLPTRAGRALRAVLIAGCVWLSLMALYDPTRVGPWLETRVIDLFFRLAYPDRSQAELATGQELPSAHRQDDVVVLALDDDTILHLGWPLPRLHWARLIDAVATAKPQSLIFDVALVDPSREHPEWDTAIGDAAQRAGNVSFSFTLARVTGESRRPLTDAALRALDANSIPWHESAASLPEYTDIVGGDVLPQPLIEPVADHAQAIAMANVSLDAGDDVLRHSLLVARLKQRLLPSLSLRLAAQALGVPLSEVRIYPGSHVDLGGKRRIPIDGLGRTLVRYQGRHDARGQGPFRYLSIWSLLRSDWSITLDGSPMGGDQRFGVDDQTKVTRDGVKVSLAEVEALAMKPGAVISGRALYSSDPGRLVELNVTTDAPAPASPDFDLLDEHVMRFTTTVATAQNNRVDLSSLTGKHLFVGSTALAAADMRNSPLGETPGVEHHATMLANLLHDDVFHEAPMWANRVAMLVGALLAAVIGVSLSGEVGLLVISLLVLTWLTTAFVLFSSGLYVPPVGPVIAAGGSALFSLVLGARASRNAHARAASEREFVRQTFGRYLTEQVVQQLLDSPDGLRLGGQRDFVTIMMTDLRGFTSMCGTMEPEAVVKLLNHYLEAMTRIIARYGGTIDEFIGDAILVVFGAPVPLEHEELRAVACAIEMLNAMPAINAWNTENRLPSVEMGIGIHSGEVVLGNIGSELRAKYGIVGSTINLTSRVESYTVGGQVLLSEATRERCGDALTVGASQVVSPKGVKGTMTIFEALGVSGPYSVSLQSANEELVAPRAPLQLRYAVIKNKQVAEETHLAQVERLSDRGLELRIDEALPVLTDLHLKVLEADGPRPGELYGKVLKADVRPGVIYLRLTSVPAELRPVLDAARGDVPPPAAHGAESALVIA